MSFFVAKDGTSVAVSVVRQTQPGFWLVTDSAGRKSVAGSLEYWHPGDRVAVIMGRIVGRVGKTPPGKTYQV